MNKSPYTYTVQDVVGMTGYTNTWIIKLAQRGEVGIQMFKFSSWAFCSADVEYLKARKHLRTPGRPRMLRESNGK